VKLKHYTDAISIELQQAIEKSLKALYAYNGIKIPKTHDLNELLFGYKDILSMDKDTEELLDIASNYYSDQRYPNPGYSMPDQPEINSVLKLAGKIMDTVKIYILKEQDTDTKSKK